jgi:biopolymer transport protein ExbD
MKRRRKNREAEDFQMAPMIDMVFLLLVFFMCVSSLAQADKSIEIDLPESAESKVPENLSGRGIVSVKEDGSIYMGARAVSLEELRVEVSRALRETPDLRVQVRADALTRFENIQTVLKACAEAGAVDVIYSTYQSR